jgi:hypothetical protein
MSLKQHVQPTSDNYTNNTDVIITANGSTDLSRAAFRGGALVGYESGNSRPPEEIPVEFVDWPFTKDDVSFADHLEVVKRERPRYAVAPDVEDAEELDTAISQADRLAEYADVVIMVPKSVKPSVIPERFRVGIPAQERFGGMPWPVWEYRGCGEVHILGGSPKRQKELAAYLQRVDSVDSTSPQKGAKFGDVWTGEEWEELDTNYYDRIEQSMNNCLHMWNEKVDESRIRQIRLCVEAPQPVREEEQVTVASVSPVIEPPTREEMVVAPNERTPHPGRAFFEQKNARTIRGLRAEDYFAAL